MPEICEHWDTCCPGNEAESPHCLQQPAPLLHHCTCLSCKKAKTQPELLGVTARLTSLTDSTAQHIVVPQGPTQKRSRAATNKATQSSVNDSSSHAAAACVEKRAPALSVSCLCHLLNAVAEDGLIAASQPQASWACCTSTLTCCMTLSCLVLLLFFPCLLHELGLSLRPLSMLGCMRLWHPWSEMCKLTVPIC